MAVPPEFPFARERVLLAEVSNAAIAAATLAAPSIGDFPTRVRSNAPTNIADLGRRPAAVVAGRR